jgi:hypothetical protein
VLHGFRARHPDVVLDLVEHSFDHRDAPARLGHRTRSLDKFMQLAAAGEVVGLAAAWVEPVFARPGIAFVAVSDVEPATTALAWPPDPPNPLVDLLVALAREVRDAVGFSTQLARSAGPAPPPPPGSGADGLAQ